VCTAGMVSNRATTRSSARMPTTVHPHHRNTRRNGWTGTAVMGGYLCWPVQARTGPKRSKVAGTVRQSPEVILRIESSCDETAAAVMVDGALRSNVVAGQEVHRHWGGVVPELAGRAHQEQIVPVVHRALAEAGIDRRDLTAIAVTRGPGLMGALLVG